MSIHSKFLFPALVGGLLASTASPLRADVTIEQKLDISAGGAMSMMASTGTITTQISGERARTDNEVEMKSAMMRRFAGNGETATIVRLDQDRMITLVPAERQYSEMTFEQMRAQMEQSMAAMQNMQDGGALPVSEDECQWSEPDIAVQETGEKERFAGVRARQTVITAKQTCTVPETDKSCTMAWNLEFWNAKRMPGDDEAQAFQQAMAAAMGGDEMMDLARTNYAGLLAMFEQGWQEVLERSGSMDGYPVKTVMSMDIGGEHCTTESGDPIAMDDIWSDAAMAGVDAAGSAAAYHAGAAAGRAVAESVGGGVAGSIAGSALGSASRELASGMFKKFGKKKDEPEPEAGSETTDPANTMVRLFTVTTELTGVSDDDVDPSRFEVPEGWTEVSPPGP